MPAVRIGIETPTAVGGKENLVNEAINSFEVQTIATADELGRTNLETPDIVKMNTVAGKMPNFTVFDGGDIFFCLPAFTTNLVVMDIDAMNRPLVKRTIADKLNPFYGTGEGICQIQQTNRIFCQRIQLEYAAADTFISLCCAALKCNRRMHLNIADKIAAGRNDYKTALPA